MLRSLKRQYKLFLSLVTLTSVSLSLMAGSVSAIAHGYSTEDDGLQTGMVVSLGSDSNVERASQETSDKIIGIVTTLDDSLVTVSSGSSKVLVENEGQVDGYVSDINGDVKQGDLLVLSPLKGILMKSAENSPGKVVGIAASDPQDSTSYSYQSDGKSKDTQISKLKVNLSYQAGSANGQTSSDSSLAKLGRLVVGKEVSETRVLVALIIFVIVLIAEGGIIYGAVSSAITSLGRNPLAKKIIRSELARVVIIAVVVLGLGLGAVYTILRI